MSSRIEGAKLRMLQALAEGKTPEAVMPNAYHRGRTLGALLRHRLVHEGSWCLTSAGRAWVEPRDPAAPRRPARPAPPGSRARLDLEQTYPVTCESCSVPVLGLRATQPTTIAAGRCPGCNPGGGR